LNINMSSGCLLTLFMAGSVQDWSAAGAFILDQLCYSFLLFK